MISKKGYTFESTGRTIPLDKINLADLEPEEFKELKETNVSMLTQMQTNDRVHNIESKIDNLITRIDKAILISDKINKDSKLHQSICPINEEAIEDLFNAWYSGIMSEYNDLESPRGKRFTEKVIKDVKTWIKDTILTSGNIAGALIALTFFFGGIGVIVYLATKFAEQ